MEAITKKSYAQDWKSYDKASTNQKTLFLELLADLCQNITPPTYMFGRPRIPIQDLIFASGLKVYTTFSLRRFMSDLKTAREKNLIVSTPCYSSVGHFMQQESLTSILHELITLSSLPLASIETKFAADSSGFGTTRFARYFSYKHQRDLKYHQWLKAHVIVGTRTNICTTARITKESAHDSPQFKALIETTTKNFVIQEVSADKAYSSRANLGIVDDLGGIAFIPFRENSKGRSKGSSPLWKKMWHYFNYNKEEFLHHYHLRSNSETFFHMTKAKFGDSLKSKTSKAQENELLLKILCNNICVLIQEMHELGISVELHPNNLNKGEQEEKPCSN